jgi:hypothetical protein
MSSTAADYRRHAAVCLALAERVSNTLDKARLIDMAQEFLKMVGKQEQREKDLTEG